MRGGTALTAVHRTAQLHPGNTLFYDGTRNTDANSRKSLSYSYAECWEAVGHHRAWLTSHVACQIAASRAALKTQARQHQRQIDDGPDIAAHAVEVVVAYLGVNSPDYLLSVLACTAVEHVPSLSDYACVRVRPALLNYRWTEGEISHALRVQEPKGAAVDADRSSTSSTEHLHVTILLRCIIRRHRCTCQAC